MFVIEINRGLLSARKKATLKSFKFKMDTIRSALLCLSLMDVRKARQSVSGAVCGRSLVES